MRRSPVLALAFLVTLASPAAAKDPSTTPADRALDQGNALVKAQEWTKAASEFGRGIAEAHKARDLAGEERLADALESLVDRVAEEEIRDLGRDGGSRQMVLPTVPDALASALETLDPKRHGALVSAHALATEILVSAAWSGVSKHVPEAADALAAFGGAPKAGKAGPLLAKWAAGAKAAAASDDAAAEPVLEAAAKSFADAGFLEFALASATDWAAARMRVHGSNEAVKAIAWAGGIVDEKSDAEVVRRFLRGVRVRWKPPPAPFLDALKPVIDRFEHRSSAGGAGGRGGKGGSAHGDVSAVGKVLRSLGNDKPIVTVARAKGEFTVRAAFDKALRDTRETMDGQRYWDAGGVTVAFAGPAVALRMVDVEGLLGQPGERSRRSTTRAFYFLADGETFAASKSGVVVTP